MRYLTSVAICTVFLLFHNISVAKNGNTDELLTLLKLITTDPTQQQLMASMGKPAKVEEKNRHTWWYYDQGENNVSICWNNKDAQLERIDFKSENEKKDTLTISIGANLQSGKTELQQAVKLLGIPKYMLIKENRQEVHYVYNTSTLRLFFRDRVLVDYALISQNTIR